MDNKKAFERILDAEVLSFLIYSKLYKKEKESKLKGKLKGLIDLDTQHIKLWEGLCGNLGIKSKTSKHHLEVGSVLLMRKFFGKNLAFSMINSLENRKISDISKVFNKIPDKDRADFIDYMVEELEQEALLKKNVKANSIMSHIRDIVFGMNDGLVEVLAAVSGFTSVLQSNLLIAVAGAIVGVSGTISMAVGAYLSSKSEKDVGMDNLSRLELEFQVARERLGRHIKLTNEAHSYYSKNIGELISKLKKFKDPSYKILEREAENPLLEDAGVRHNHYENPVKDAAYVGAFYLIGAVIPLVSFLIGVPLKSNEYLNLVISIVLTMIAIAIVSFLIALNSNEKIGRYIVRSISLSFVATIITFLIGHLASVYLHLAL